MRRVSSNERVINVALPPPTVDASGRETADEMLLLQQPEADGTFLVGRRERKSPRSPPPSPPSSRPSSGGAADEGTRGPGTADHAAAIGCVRLPAPGFVAKEPEVALAPPEAEPEQ